MEMAGSRPPFPTFEVYGEESSLGIRWTKYISKLENLFVALNVEFRKRKKSLILHYTGDDVFEIYETLNLGANDSNFDIVKQQLTK